MNKEPPEFDGAVGIDDILEDHLRADELAQRRYEAALRAHPNCMDPDHPGCENCCDQ